MRVIIYALDLRWRRKTRPADMHALRHESAGLEVTSSVKTVSTYME